MSALRPFRLPALGFAALSCALVMTLSGCDDSSEAPAGGGSAPTETQRQEPRPTETRRVEPSNRTTEPTRPTSRPSEFPPTNCPAGLVC